MKIFFFPVVPQLIARLAQYHFLDITALQESPDSLILHSFQLLPNTALCFFLLHQVVARGITHVKWWMPQIYLTALFGEAVRKRWERLSHSVAIKIHNPVLAQQHIPELNAIGSGAQNHVTAADMLASHALHTSSARMVQHQVNPAHNKWVIYFLQLLHIVSIYLKTYTSESFLHMHRDFRSLIRCKPKSKATHTSHADVLKIHPAVWISYPVAQDGCGLKYNLQAEAVR